MPLSLSFERATVDEARRGNCDAYKLDGEPVTAILEMPEALRRLANLERLRIENEYKLVSAAIRDLEDLLKSPERASACNQRTKRSEENFGDPRRTQIIRLGEGENASEYLAQNRYNAYGAFLGPSSQAVSFLALKASQLAALVALMPLDYVTYQ